MFITILVCTVLKLLDTTTSHFNALFCSHVTIPTPTLRYRAFKDIIIHLIGHKRRVDCILHEQFKLTDPNQNNCCHRLVGTIILRCFVAQPAQFWILHC